VKLLEAGGTGGKGRAGLYLAAGVRSLAVGDKDPILAVGIGRAQTGPIVVLVGQ
jgi:hypothetical protein